MTQEEAKKILSGYVKACNEDDFLTLEMFEYEEVIEAMTMGAKALSQPSLPSNLDEAANKFAHLYDQGTCDGVAQECFKAGAEWMAEQGVSMQVTDDTEWSEVDLVVHKNVREGSIIQIRKAE